MRHADFKHFLKTALLLTTAILIVGNTAAISITSPTDGGNIADDFEIKATDFTSSNVNITIDGPKRVEKEANINGDNATASFVVGDGSYGDYEIKAEEIDSNNTVVGSQSINVLVDGTEPEVTKKNNVEYVGGDPTIEFSVSDQYTAVTSFSASSVTASVSDGSKSNVCGAGGQCTVSVDVDTGELSNGDVFSLEVDASDGVGNQFSDSFSYTYDSSFQADTPTFTVEGNDDGVVSLDGDVSVDVTVGNIDQETSDEVRVKCLVDGEEVSTSDWDDSESFSCNLPENDVKDDTVEVSVEACDRAGHCSESDEKSITFDGSDPVLESFSTVQEYRVFGDDFNVQYQASDSATSIQSVEYFFSTSVIPGEGNQASPEDQEFKVETSLLSGNSNQHTVYMRVKDEAGRWSDYKSIDFEYYPNANPSVSLTVPQNFSVKAGSSKGFDVVVENTGKLMIDELNVSLSSDLIEGEKTVENLKGGETRNVEFSVEPKADQIGKWPVEVSTNGPTASESTDILVEANSNQRNTVDSKLENYTALLETLNSNISALKEDGLNDNLENSLYSGVSSFRQTLKTAQDYVDQGDYYKAYSTLENVEAQYSEAEQTFSEVSKKHSINERNSTIMMVLVGLALVLVASGAYVYTSEEYEMLENIGDDGYQLPELGGFGEKMSQKISNFKEFLRKEEEEAEEAFQGFQ